MICTVRITLAQKMKIKNVDYDACRKCDVVLLMAWIKVIAHGFYDLEMFLGLWIPLMAIIFRAWKRTLCVLTST